MQTTLKRDAAEHSRAVREMFAGIAGRYDLLNHLLSLNIDKGWRRKVRAEIAETLADINAIVLDVACGTGDLSLELKHGANATVIATDFCRPMLAVAATKIASDAIDLPLVEGDARSLSFADESFDAVTIAFGLRNLPDHHAGLRELLRVLKPEGKLVVLECSNPSIAGFRQLFSFYFEKIVPRIGGVISGSRGAYTYLPDSVSRFPDKKTLASMMESAGFLNVRFRSLTGGTAAIHIGTKA